MRHQTATLQAEYHERFAKITEYRRQVWKILCNDYFSRLIPPTAQVLDLGCGYGEFSNALVAAKKYAMDLNPDAATRLQPDVTLFPQDCAAPWPLPDASLDVVFTSNFLEHLPDKAHVARTVAEAYRCLKPGGQLICLGPNIKFVPGAYWDFWDHYVPITEASLAELLKLEQFTVTISIDRFLPYSMSTGRTPPLIFLRLYLKLPIVWPWFGKQFLVIGQKTA